MMQQKEKHDASTSPMMPSRKKNRNGHQPRTQYRTLAVGPNSPRREVPMRNAATSPAIDRNISNLDSTDSLPSKPVTPKHDIPAKDSPDKSKAVTTRPTRYLRTTRSLSPKPPIQHQQSIIVSNEHDVVFHVTPIDYDDEVFTSAGSDRNSNSLQLRKPRGKAHSENTSPNLSCGSFFAHDNRFANNRSTSCLEYVPTDPWIQQSAKNEKARRGLSANAKTSLDNDPWIYRQSTGGSSNRRANTSQSKTNIDIENNAARSVASPRPKLHRTKTPVAVEDIKPEKTDAIRSPPKLPPPPPSPPVAGGTEQRSRAHHFLLNVANNPSALQPRHSFSTLMPPKDDELQLNIRRLSEQVKGPGYTMPPPSGDLGKYLEQRHGKHAVPDVMSAMTVAKQTAAFCGASDADPVLETTC